MTDCKVELRVAASALVVEGPEAFVTSTLESWRDFFAGAQPLAEDAAAAGGDRKIHQSGGTSASARGGGSQQYENVFDYADGKLKIIAHVPGNNKAELTRNTALIYLYGRLLGGIESTPSDEIRQACMDQGCYDQANFAQYMKGLKSRVVMNTKPGGGYDVKLTAPGRKDAKELVERLNEQA
ncbi:MAG TPA: hypothetical protein VEA61_12155 [Allosphingosinicella sp.]|nr:hypothetical protein [Allosphingosinicella sp.]